jgi:hypothetical protein
MTKTLIAAAAGGVAVAAVLVVGVPAATGPSTIRITDVQFGYRLVPDASNGRAGDVEMVQQRLFKPPLTQSIGHSYLVCTYIDRRGRQCNGTYSLPKGTLVVSGMIQSRLLFEVAVVGGTGLYDNARGSLTVTSTHLRPRREVLVFRLAG